MKIDKLEQILLEIQAEIVGNKIPANRVYDNRGNTVDPKKVQTETRKVLNTIMQKLGKEGLVKNFGTDDIDEIDIKPGKAIGTYILTPETGKEKYEFNVNTLKLRNV